MFIAGALIPTFAKTSRYNIWEWGDTIQGSPGIFMQGQILSVYQMMTGKSSSKKCRMAI